MFKKIFSVLVLFCVINLTFLPAMSEVADEQSVADDTAETMTLSTESDSKDSSGNTIEAIFKTDLNVNKASKGQVVQFVSTEDFTKNGITIPKGTIFTGEIRNLKKSRFAYRRAKATIVIKQVILPNGQTRKVKAFTKKRTIKGSAVANVGKGIATAPFVITLGAVGVVVIFVEAITIVGIIAVVPTGYGFGRAMGTLSHGVNCKKSQGDEIKLKIKSL